METRINVNEVPVAIIITSEEVVNYRNAEIAKLQTKITSLNMKEEATIAEDMARSVISKLEKKYDGISLPDSFVWKDVKTLKRSTNSLNDYMIENGFTTGTGATMYKNSKAIYDLVIEMGGTQEAAKAKFINNLGKLESVDWKVYLVKYLELSIASEAGTGADIA